MVKRIFSRGLLVIALSALMFSQAQATVLSYSISMDDQFDIYLSTDNSVQGTLVGSGSPWMTTFTGSSFSLTPGQNYYLHVFGVNSGGGPAGFLGDFSLNGTDFVFANNTGNLLTNTSDWQVGDTGWNSYAVPVSEGTNGVGPWGTRPSINGSATWIWSGTNSNASYFTTQITAVPEPSTCLLMGIGGLGMIGMSYSKRRKTTGLA